MLWNYNAIKLMIGWARHPKYRLFLAPMCIVRNYLLVYYFIKCIGLRLKNRD